MRNKRNLPAAYKPCPKCNGSGQVLCDGKENHRALTNEWAQRFHLQPVIIKHRDKSFPGLAVKSVNPGGWGAVKVYVALTCQPNYDIHAGTEMERTFRNIMGDCPGADYFGDKALWFMHCSWGYRDDLTILETWPDKLQEMLSLTDGGKLLQQNT